MSDRNRFLKLKRFRLVVTFEEISPQDSDESGEKEDGWEAADLAEFLDESYTSK